jgi:VanZ family protein
MRVRTAQAGAVMMILLGTGLEFLQMSIPGRFFSVSDMLANVFGAVSGLFLGRHLKSYLEAVLGSLSL